MIRRGLVAWALAATVAAGQAFDAPERVFDNDRVVDPSWPTGMPLGGVGAGFLEWGCHGGVRTVGVGPGDPVTAPAGHFAVEVVVDGETSRRALVDAAHAPPGVRGIERVRFRGLFPRAFWSFRDADLPVELFVEGFAPLVPHDVEASSAPVNGFRFTITSLSEHPVSFRVRFVPSGDPLAAVDIAVAGDASGELAPGGSASRDLALAWRRDGERYASRHPDAAGFARELLERFDDLRGATRGWQGLVHRSTLPLWYRDRLINDLVPLVTNSTFTPEGRFGIREAGRGLGAILGTLDQRLVAHGMVQSFFPELDRDVLSTFASQQRDDGELQHHFGRAGVGLEPDKGFLGWPDLAASFLIQVDKHHAWTGDDRFRDAMADPAERALDWLIAADRDGDGIAEGGSTWDDAHRGDGMSYIGSVSLAAFAAAERFLRRAGREEAADRAADALLRSRRGVIDHLWNGRYLHHFVDPTTTESSTDCFLGQLAGEWYAALMGWPTLLPADLVDRALSSMVALNGGASEWIPPLEVTADGRIGRTPYGWRPYTEVYYAALLAHRGRPDDAIECLRRIDAALHRSRDPFNVVLYYDARTGEKYKPGYEWYMSTPASWFTLHAFLGASIDVVGRRLIVRPAPPSSMRELSGPVFFPTLTAWVDCRDATHGLRRDVSFEVIERHGPPVAVDELLVAPPEVGGRALSVELRVDDSPVAFTSRPDAGGGVALVPAAPLELSSRTRIDVTFAEPAIEDQATRHHERVAERTLVLENDHLRATFVRGIAGVARLTLTERRGGTSVAIAAEHLFRLRLPGPPAEVWDSDPARSRAVRVVDVRMERAGSAAACELVLDLEVRRKERGTLSARAVVRIALDDDAPRLRWSARIEGSDRESGTARLDFPVLRVRDPGRIGEPSTLLRGAPADFEVVGEVTTSDAWAGAWRRDGDERVIVRGPEAELVVTTEGAGLRAVATRGTRGDSIELSVGQRAPIEGGVLVAPVVVTMEWRRR